MMSLKKVLSAADEFMSEMHLRQPRFTYSACEPFSENNGIIQKFKETGDSRHIDQNKLNKVCFKHDVSCGNFKDLSRRTASYSKYCMRRYLMLLKIQSMMDIKEFLLQRFINVLTESLLLHTKEK